MTKKEVLVREALLGSNAKVASDLRQALRKRKILGVNLMSSPGAGKTTLLERVAERFSPLYRIAVIEGDIETERDAERIRAKGVPAWQITTGGACHLEARMIGQVVPDIPAELDFLFIENVGNLVCPAAYDLGEDLRCVLLSVPEGDDKPKKYPKAFMTAGCLLITKSDLLPALRFDVERARQEALDLNPGLEVFVLSAQTGEGLDAFLDYLVACRAKALSPDA